MRRPKCFFAIETNDGRSNMFHAFLSVAARDAWVATNPDKRSVIASTTSLARRMLRSYDLWQTVTPEITSVTHQAIPYLDR